MGGGPENIRSKSYESTGREALSGRRGFANEVNRNRALNAGGGFKNG